MRSDRAGGSWIGARSVMMRIWTEDAPARHVGGLYEDELAKIDGRWVFTSRIFRIIAEFGVQG